MSDEWRLPAPAEDPEAGKATFFPDVDGCPRLVPDGNFVEGEITDEGGKDPAGASDLPPDR
ncbi:MAG: hypothetical protein ACXW27_12310 [Allosphingosinicella sp.]